MLLTTGKRSGSRSVRLAHAVTKASFAAYRARESEHRVGARAGSPKEPDELA